ncbi:hypothetical protein Emag_007143 [Eimeria magna]
MQRQVEDSPALDEIWDEWPSPFAKVERQCEDIYLAEFPKVAAARRRGTPSWTSSLTAFSRQFIVRPSARVRRFRGWKELPEFEPAIQPDLHPAPGGLLAPSARHDEKESGEVVKARPPLPTPVSSGLSAELEGSAELSPLPAAGAPASGQAAPQTAPTSPAEPLPRESAGQGPLSPLSPTTTAAVNALGNLASEGWDKLQWVDNMSRKVAAARAVLTSLPPGQSSVAGLDGRLRQEQLGGPAVKEDQVECSVGFWLSRAKPSAAFMGPCGASVSEFLDRVYPAGQALTAGRRVGGASRAKQPSASPSTREETTPLPPLSDLSAEEFRLPEPCAKCGVRVFGTSRDG